MIKYSWSVLRRHTKNDPTKVVEFFRHASYPKHNMPDYVRRILLSKTDKSSYLLNNKEFCSNKLHGTLLERYWYIYLSSKRNLIDYELKSRLWLHSGLCDIDVSNNRLITINNFKTHFKYEEIKT